MVTLVIPCYNEAQRLPKQSFLQALQDQPDLHFMMVNDGSRDATLRMLEQLQQANPDRIGVLDLAQNVGKAEAVRQGLLAALAKVAGNTEQGFIGYWDADLATPLAELPRFMEVMDSKPQVQWVMGTRIKMLGWDVDRTMHRHYVGRVFATFAAWCLGCRVYDTQCGAKLIRVGPGLMELLREPLRSRWLLDVELLLRLRNQQNLPHEIALEKLVYELPLHQWREVGESKVKPMDLFRSIWHLWCLHRRYRNPRN